MNQIQTQKIQIRNQQQTLSSNNQSLCNNQCTNIANKKLIQSKVQRQESIHFKNNNNISINKNQIQKQSSQTQSSQMFSRQNSIKFKFSIRKLIQNNSNKKVNKNGFNSCPPPFYQLIPLILFILMSSQIITLSINQINGKIAKYLILSILTVLIIPIGYFWYLTSSIQPTDQIQLQHIQHIKDPMSKTNFDPKKHRSFCNLCNTCISQKSFHCNSCNRCVEYFDHHCKWLNNCIGAKNYVQFFKLVLLCQLYFIFFYSTNIAILIQIYKQHEQNLNGIFWYSLSVIIISFIPFVSLSILMCLHFYLVIAKRSTIQLILQYRNKSKIHPQNRPPVNQLTKKNTQFSSLAIQSPMITPINNSILNNQIKNRNQTEQMNNQSLNKFKYNLSRNLRLSKIKAPNKPLIQNQRKQNIKNDLSIGIEQTNIMFQPKLLKKSLNNENIIKNQIKLQPIITDKYQTKQSISQKQIQKKNQKQILKIDKTYKISEKIEKTEQNQQNSSKIVTQRKIRFQTKLNILSSDRQNKVKQKDQKQNINMIITTKQIIRSKNKRQQKNKIQNQLIKNTKIQNQRFFNDLSNQYN